MVPKLEQIGASFSARETLIGRLGKTVLSSRNGMGAQSGFAPHFRFIVNLSDGMDSEHREEY